MKNNNEKQLFITELTESDFRRLNLWAYEQEEETCKEDRRRDRFVWKRVSLNNILDEVIEILNNNREEGEGLSKSIYFAIHNENGLSSDPVNYYFDKNMNSFTGPRTFQLGIGLEHLYSTRDYFETKDHLWKVKKSETKAFYCVHLDLKTDK